MHLADTSTTPRKLTSGVSQGFVLWPLLFILYTADIDLLVEATVYFTTANQMARKFNIIDADPDTVTDLQRLTFEGESEAA